jgi:proteasome accessory factor C
MSADPFDSLRHALTIIPLIQSHQGITVQELARRTGLTETEITDEVGRLVMMCGVPPYQPNNYVSLWVQDGRVFIRFAEQFERPVRLVLSEALALLLALRPLEAREHPFHDAVRALRKKIHAALAPDAQRAIRRAERTFHVRRTGAGGRIEQLREAMARCRELRIVYWSAHRAATSARTIRPYGMVEHGGDWYVVAHDSVRGKPVTFRVDRIREAELLDTEYEIPPDFDVQEWNKDRDFVPPPGRTVARVLFSRDAAKFAREELPAKDCQPRPDGSLVARVPVASEAWFLSWLFQFGRHAEVLDPPELREKVRATCRAVLAFYDAPAAKV